MTNQGYGQWEYRLAVVDAEGGVLLTVDGRGGPVLSVPGSSAPMTVVQALDVWGATGWDLVGVAALSGDRLQYVLKRPRHHGGWEGASIHQEARKG